MGAVLLNPEWLHKSLSNNTTHWKNLPVLAPELNGWGLWPSICHTATVFPYILKPRQTFSSPGKSVNTLGSSHNYPKGQKKLPQISADHKPLLVVSNLPTVTHLWFNRLESRRGSEKRGSTLHGLQPQLAAFPLKGLEPLKEPGKTHASRMITWCKKPGLFNMLPDFC